MQVKGEHLRFDDGNSRLVDLKAPRLEEEGRSFLRLGVH